MTSTYPSKTKPVLLVTHDIWIPSIAQFHLTFATTILFITKSCCLCLPYKEAITILPHFQSLLAYLLPTLPESDKNTAVSESVTVAVAAGGLNRLTSCIYSSYLTCDEEDNLIMKYDDTIY